VSRWRRLTRKAEGIAEWKDANAHNYKLNGLTYLAQLDPATASALMNDPQYLSFVIVRNPFVRILSAYIDKSQPMFQDKFHLPSTFAEFVRSLRNQSVFQMDPHWYVPVLFY